MNLEEPAHLKFWQKYTESMRISRKNKDLTRKNITLLQDINP